MTKLTGVDQLGDTDDTRNAINSTRGHSLTLPIVPLIVAAMIFCSAAPGGAVSGANEDKPLSYGLFWVKDDGSVPLDAVVRSGSGWIKDPAAESGDSPYYDPSRPTMIYFHGWRPGGGREDFQWTPGDSLPTVDTLAAWKREGWNVGIFHWDQFAHTPLDAGRAQRKIWSSNTHVGLTYRYNSGAGRGVSEKYPDSEDLGLPAWLPGFPHYPWDNQSKASQAISGVKFVLGQDTGTGIAEVRASVRNLNLWSCEEEVRRLACGQAQASPLCSFPSDRLDWREVFFTKICQRPSVGDLAFEIIRLALADQSERTVVFAGHSLGHQLATRTAAHLWMAHIHHASQGVAGSEAALPKRLELLDPYARTPVQPYLRKYSHDGLDQDRATRTIPSRVANYVKRLKTISSELAGSTFDFPVSYYQSSLLSHLPLATINPELIHEVAYQRHRFDYVRIWRQDIKHGAAKNWYFASLDEADGFPPLSNSSGALSSQQGLSARAANSHVAEAMPAAGSGGVSFRQSEGMLDPDLSTDVFEAQNISAMVWPGNLDITDVPGAQEELRRRLFSNQLTLTVDNVIDELYVNGEPITGSLENRRNWTVVDVVDNLELHNGHNVIAIKARDTGGPAALLAELDLDGDLHVSDETWKVTTSTPPSDWMETDFDDSDWPAATVHAAYGSESWGTRVDGISDDSAANWIWSSDREGDDVVYFRYRIPAGGPWKVRVADSNSEIRDLSTAEAVMDAFIAADAADGTDDFSQTADVINFFTIDGGTKGQYEDDVPFPGQPNPPTTFALQVTGTVLIESAGNYTFGFNVDDGARLDITKDGVVTTIVQQGGTQPPVTRLGHIYLEPGTYELELLYYNNRGSGALELFAAKGVHSSWNASDFKLLLPEDHLDRINATEADTDVCFDDAAGLESGRTGNSITQTWSNLALAGGVDAFFAHIQTYDGRDTAVVRARNVESSPQIKIEEEKSRDSEVNHATEVVGYLTVDTSGSREIRDTDNVLIGYAGPTLSLDHTWTTVSLPHRFTNPVVIAYLRSTPNGEGVHTRLRNVGATSFEVQIEDWAYQSFAPSGEVDYIVLEQGAHLLRDAQILQVGTETVTQEVQDVFTDVVFPLAFDAPPVVLSATQTRNGSDPMVTRHQSISTTGFSVLVEEEEARDNIHISETIGWVALSGDIDPISGSSCP